MVMPARKIVFTPVRGDIEVIARLVRRARYPSVSAFVRDAVHEQLKRLRDERMFAAVERYCAGGPDDTDDLVSAQAFEEP